MYIYECVYSLDKDLNIALYDTFSANVTIKRIYVYSELKSMIWTSLNNTYSNAKNPKRIWVNSMFYWTGQCRTHNRLQDAQLAFWQSQRSNFKRIIM